MHDQKYLPSTYIKKKKNSPFLLLNMKFFIDQGKQFFSPPNDSK